VKEVESSSEVGTVTYSDRQGGGSRPYGSYQDLKRGTEPPQWRGRATLPVLEGLEADTKFHSKAFLRKSRFSAVRGNKLRKE